MESLHMKYFLALLTLTLAACASPSSRIDDQPQIFQQATPEQQAMIRQGHVGLGFTPDFVRLAMGDPNRITERQDQSGVQTIWHYTSDPNYTYVGAGYGWGYGGPWYWGGRFAPVTVVTAPVEDSDRLRVVFQNNQAVSVERVVKAE